jgi:uncharacterized membrane protein
VHPGLGGVLGTVGGVLGAFCGYQAGTRLVKAIRCKDLVVAVGEDLVAVAGCFWAVSHV